MSEKKFVSYLRVSTERQGRSGLGLEAQRRAVADCLNGNGWELVGEFVEVESGRDSERPELAKALACARIHRAQLVVAKLDRLSRDAAFILSALRDADVDFVCADMPQADEMTVGILAVVAEREAKMISERTRKALAEAKARGTKLGNPENLTDEARRKGTRASAEVRGARADRRARDLRGPIDEIRAQGASSLREIAVGLDRRGIPTARGSTWTASAVRRVLRRLEGTESRGNR